MAAPAFAQYDVHFSQYWAVESFYNPAAMNPGDKMDITGCYSMQLAGYTHAPSSMYLGANTALPGSSQRHTGGIGLMNETIGLFSHKRLYGEYAYRLGLGKAGSLNLGIQAGILNEAFEYSDLETIDPSDPAFPSGNEDGNALDLGAGVCWKWHEWHAGISVQHLTNPTITYGKSEGKSAELVINPSFYFIGGGNIRLTNPLLSLQPSVMAASDLGVFRLDLSLRGTYEYDSNRFTGGISYSPGTSVSFILGGMIKQVTVGYAYEMFTNGIGWLAGSHDLVVSYLMDADFFKKGKNIHKSVRYL